MLAVLFYAASFYSFNLSLRALEISVAYAVWSAVVMAALALIGMTVLGESVSLTKVAGISAYIDPVKRPLLVAGDSRSDWAMLFRSGDVRLWVNRKPKDTAALVRLREARAAEDPQADKGWIVVTQDELEK